jgi:2-isopropylmalate synthase
MNPAQKVRLALLIEDLGADVIEVGFPASSPSELEALTLLSQRLTSARFASFCRAVRADVQVAVRAGGVANHQIQILATGSELHLNNKRGISRNHAINEVVDTVAFAARLGITDISLGLEDASRGSDDLLKAMMERSIDAGVTTVALADTSGCMLPDEFGEMMAKARSWVPDGIILSTHCHDDLGLAVANTLAGIEGGADEVQVTLAGIGERAGNAAMEEVVAAVHYKGNLLGVSTDIKTERLYEVYQVLADVIGLEPQRTKAVFGTNAFATQAGIHQAGMLRDPATYEYLEPGLFGLERSMLVGRHSGRAVLRHLLDQLGVAEDEELLDQLYTEYVLDRVGGECDELGVVREQLAKRLADTGLVV